MVLAPSVAGLFKWRQFEPEMILLAVGWYLRFSLSYRDVEELLAERGLLVDHVTVWRWVQRYAPEIQRQLRLRLRAQCFPRGRHAEGGESVKHAAWQFIQAAQSELKHVCITLVLQRQTGGVEIRMVLAPAVEIARGKFVFRHFAGEGAEQERVI